MRRRRGALKFKELAQRLTGVQIPLFGVSWNAPEPQRNIVRGVLAFLEDRRVLYNPYNLEIEREVSESVLEIRRELTQRRRQRRWRVGVGRRQRFSSEVEAD